MTMSVRMHVYPEQVCEQSLYVEKILNNCLSRLIGSKINLHQMIIDTLLAKLTPIYGEMIIDVVFDNCISHKIFEVVIIASLIGFVRIICHCIILCILLTVLSMMSIL